MRKKYAKRWSRARVWFTRALKSRKVASSEILSSWKINKAQVAVKHVFYYVQQRDKDILRAQICVFILRNSEKGDPISSADTERSQQSREYNVSDTRLVCGFASASNSLPTNHPTHPHSPPLFDLLRPTLIRVSAADSDS